MDFKDLIGRFRGWLLDKGLKMGIGYLLKRLGDANTRAKMKALGNTLGRKVGQLIPSEEADGFAAAFLTGFTTGLNETDGPQPDPSNPSPVTPQVN